MSKHNEAMIRASGFYLTDYLDEELLEGDEDVLDEFVLAHAWEPFEHYEVNDLYKLIVELSDSFEELML
jgi:hypothetical protein